jgi:hypothetical protein
MIRGDFKSGGLIEDEMSNLLIDCWCAVNRRSPECPQMFQYVDAKTGEVMMSDTPVSVTITLKNRD